MALLPENIPGEKLLTKIWETVTERGIGGLLTPWQIRREGRARNEVRREELLMFAQTEQDIADIRSGKKEYDEKGKLVVLPSGTIGDLKALPAPPPTATETLPSINDQASVEPSKPPRVIDAIVREVNTREAERGVNLRRTILEAEKQSEKAEDDTVSDKPIDKDWFERWRESAQTVSNENMRRLWAAILAGEAKSPGTYSLRTMAFLRELSTNEAKLIEKAAQFVVNGDIIFRTDSLATHGLPYGALLTLQNLGIISGVEAIGVNWQLASFVKEKYLSAFVCDDYGLVVEHSDSKRVAEIPCYTLTNVGREIISLGAFDANRAYMRELGEWLKAKGYKVRIGKVIKKAHNFRWNDQDLQNL